jgi:hypothetical protein
MRNVDVDVLDGFGKFIIIIVFIVACRFGFFTTYSRPVSSCYLQVP